MAKKLRPFIYLASFFVGLHMSFAAYTSSSFLADYVGEKNVGLVYIAAAVFALIGLIYGPNLIVRYGYIKTTILASVLGIISAVSLFFGPSLIPALLAFTTYYVIAILLRFIIDIYLENFSDDGNTGGIRGLFMTSHNLAWIISPVAAGALVAWTGSLSITYLVSGLAILPIIALFAFALKEVDTKNIPEVSLWKTVYKVWCRDNTCNHNLYKILAVDLFLNIFFSVMVIYTPVYLNTVVGLDWDKIGIIFTIMLLPYVFLQYPLGKIADKYLGEKEILTTGIVITAFFTLLLPVVNTPNIYVWGALLFMTRVGASAVSAMKEIYLFKVVDSVDLDIISFFRKTPPLAYIITPIVGTAVIYLFGFTGLFIGTAFLMLSSVYYALTLTDTK